MTIGFTTQSHVSITCTTAWPQACTRAIHIIYLRTGKFLEIGEGLFLSCWISANRHKGVAEQKIERRNGKAARGGLPALTVAKDRLEGEQWVPGDLPGKPIEAPDLKGAQQ